MAEIQQPEVLQERSVTIDPITGHKIVHPRLERRLVDFCGQQLWMTVSVFDEPEDQDLAEVFRQT